MRRILIAPGVLLLAACLVCSCGLGGAQTRPLLVDTFPAAGQILTGPLQEIRLTYDMPVTVLNPDDVRVFTRTFSFLPTRLEQRPGEPNSVYVHPLGQPSFPLDDDFILQVAEGAVVNDLQHYAEQQADVPFTVGVEPPLLVGEPDAVTLLDSFTFASLGSVPTPVATAPVAIVSTIRGAVQRVWVQLDAGGGTGASLGWFEPGDVAMATIPLTAGGDLTAASGALTVGPNGRFLYAAFRDTDTGGVRLVRVDTDTALESGSLLLTAVPAGGGTMPVDLRWSEDGTQLIVAAAIGGSGRLAFVDRETFAEVDRDAVLGGIQGFTLPADPGRFVPAGGRFWVTRPGTNDMDVVASDGTLTVSAGTVTGTGGALLRSPANDFLVQAMSGYTGNLALQTRAAATGFLSPLAGEIVDDLGGVDLGSSTVLDLQHLPGTARFGALLGTADGRLIAFMDFLPSALDQEDLDTGTAGVQVADVDAVVPAAMFLGRTYGAFAP